MIGYVTLGVNDMERAKTFYGSLFADNGGKVVMDQGRIAGVGNIYACEALYLSGINPTREAGKVSKPRLAKLVQAIKEVLGAAIESGKEKRPILSIVVGRACDHRSCYKQPPMTA